VRKSNEAAQELETWYRWGRIMQEPPRAFRVIRATEHRITFLHGERRQAEARNSSWHRWFRTLAEANEHVEREALRNLEAAEARLKRARLDVEWAKGLRDE
jgi:hypothetical protein